MNKTVHSAYIAIMVVITIFITLYLSYTGYSYYSTAMEERFYHPQYDWFKPSGKFGLGLGIVGTLMILFGVTIYIARKRYNFMSKYLRLKYLLEFHIFLCTLGPILIIFHTTFKYGGIVSVAFWSMIAVVLSGVVGRFIYIQIPRTIEGRELSLSEVQGMKTDLSFIFREKYKLDDDAINVLVSFTSEENLSNDKKSIRKLRKELQRINLAKQERRSILKMVKSERSLSGRIARLEKMQKLLKYWHVAHLPFALIMLIIAIIHVIVSLTFGLNLSF